MLFDLFDLDVELNLFLSWQIKGTNRYYKNVNLVDFIDYSVNGTGRVLGNKHSTTRKSLLSFNLTQPPGSHHFLASSLLFFLLVPPQHSSVWLATHLTKNSSHALKNICSLYLLLEKHFYHHFCISESQTEETSIRHEPTFFFLYYFRISPFWSMSEISSRWA